MLYPQDYALAHYDLTALVARVWQTGVLVPSRYGDTRELLGQQLRWQPGLVPVRQGANLSLGWMEGLQFVGGLYDSDAIKRVAPKANLALFTKDMAYGPRVWDQMIYLIGALQGQPNTRQAVLWVANRLDGISPKQPCTTTIQFLLRDSRLHMVVNMRSWDLVKGLTYDLIQFGFFQLCVARAIAWPAGTLIVNAGSAHIYCDDALSNKLEYTVAPWSFDLHPSVGGSWSEIAGRAAYESGQLQQGMDPDMVVRYERSR